MSVISEVLDHIAALGAGHELNVSFYGDETHALANAVDLFGLKTPESPKNIVTVLPLGGRRPDSRRMAAYPAFVISARNEYPGRAYNTIAKAISHFHKNANVFSVPGIVYGLNSQPHSVYISPGSEQSFVSSFMVMLSKMI